MKRLIPLLLAIALLLTACGQPKNPYAEIEQNPVATITLTDGSQMRFELYPQQAPNTVANFVKLANGGFYDNQQIYRVVSNVLIQSGDPNNDGTGDPGYYIRGEFSENRFKGNTLSHMRGTISMARKSDYDTGGSQFFIMEGSYPEYDGYYAAFGRIMDEESLSVLDDIGSRPVDGSYVPLDKIVIQRIRVETYDVEYEPQTLNKKDIDNRKSKRK
ncbi:MAG: peptidylprolyl isomerase [Clostridia bacterium]|nr:peptidylprolyl isomerase [Clostridia bacterium]